MPRPVVSQAAEEFYEFLEAFVEEDEDTEWETLLWCEAIMGGTPQTVLAWVTDRSGDIPGWGYLFNADLADANALPWLSQFNGTKLREDMSVAEQRAAIKSPAGFERGTPAALQSAPLNYLTGTKLVHMREREEGKPYKLHIRTLLSETPDPDAVLQALLLQKPAGIVLDYDAITGQDWIDVKEKGTWDDIKSEYETWDDVKADIP